jgi:hypothetical protein
MKQILVFALLATAIFNAGCANEEVKQGDLKIAKGTPVEASERSKEINKEMTTTKTWKPEYEAWVKEMIATKEFKQMARITPVIQYALELGAISKEKAIELLTLAKDVENAGEDSYFGEVISRINK